MTLSLTSAFSPEVLVSMAHTAGGALQVVASIGGVPLAAPTSLDPDQFRSAGSLPLVVVIIARARADVVESPTVVAPVSAPILTRAGGNVSFAGSAFAAAASRLSCMLRVGSQSTALPFAVHVINDAQVVCTVSPSKLASVAVPSNVTVELFILGSVLVSAQRVLIASDICGGCGASATCLLATHECTCKYVTRLLCPQLRAL